MAQLPGGDWLIQQIEDEVILFQRYTEDEIVRFRPTDADELVKAQHTISNDVRLTGEQKAFAHFWSGYFYANGVL